MSTVTPSLDAIVNASRNSGIPVADIVLALAAAQTGADAPAQPKAAPTMPAKREAKRDWKSAPATQGQHDRITRAEEAIIATGRKRGIALILRATMREDALATGLDARAYYRTLASFCAKHGIDFSA